MKLFIILTATLRIIAQKTCRSKPVPAMQRCMAIFPSLAGLMVAIVSVNANLFVILTRSMQIVIPSIYVLRISRKLHAEN